MGTVGLAPAVPFAVEAISASRLLSLPLSGPGLHRFLEAAQTLACQFAFFSRERLPTSFENTPGIA
jgi:hypothetical protein